MDIEAIARKHGDVTEDARGRVTFSFDNYGIAALAHEIRAWEKQACATLLENQRYMTLNPLRTYTADEAWQLVRSSVRNLTQMLRKRSNAEITGSPKASPG